MQARLQFSACLLIALAAAAEPIFEALPNEVRLQANSGSDSFVITIQPGGPMMEGAMTYCRALNRVDLNIKVGECVVSCMAFAASTSGFIPAEPLQADALTANAHDVKADAYFSLLTSAIIGSLYPTHGSKDWSSDDNITPYNEQTRVLGQDWPVIGYSMCGLVRTQLLRTMMEIVIAENIEGDFLEAGVWRGGQSIFAKLLWNWYGQSHRRVLLCDSFEGLPLASTKHDGNDWHEMTYLAVSLGDVQAAFKLFGITLDDTIVFFKGFFQESLPKLRMSEADLKLSILRVSGNHAK
jgi:Macrocin-O-methyltransferase (TylF)